jgi:hypothetical protein
MTFILAYFDYNTLNGITLRIGYVELDGMDGSLLGVCFWSNYVMLELLYLRIEIDL